MRFSPLFRRWFRSFYARPAQSYTRKRKDHVSRPILEALEDRLTPTTHVWQGPAAGGLWSNPANWTNGLPGPNDTVQFSSAGGVSSTDDMPGLILDEVHFTVGGNTVLGTGGVTLGIAGFGNDLVNDTGTNTIDTSLPIVNSAGITYVLVSAGQLNLNSVISGPEALELRPGSALGTLQLGAGAADASNTYAGDTFVDDGTLLLNKNGGAIAAQAIPHNLVVGDGSGAANSAVVRENHPNEIDNGATVTVNSDGLFDTNGNTDTVNQIANLTVHSGNIATGAGAVNPTGTMSFDSDNATLTITATGTADGSASFNGAASFNFTGINALSFTSNSGTSNLTINNPAGGLFAPAGGITDAGAGVAGNALDDLGGGSGATDSGSYTPTSGTPGSGTLSHTEGGTVQTINFSGLSPTTDTVAGATFTVNGTSAGENININTGPIAPDGTQTDQVNSSPETFELVNFGNKTTVAVNGVDGVDTITVNIPTLADGLSTLDVNGGPTAGDVVNMQAIPAGLTTNWVGGANATVNVGLGGSLAAISGPVNLENPPALNTIVVDNSADTIGRTVTLSSFTPNPSDSEGNADVYGRIHGLAPADINYEYSDSGNLTIDGGSGGNIWNVNSTDFGPITNTINGGNSGDTFNIDASGLGKSSTNDFNGGTGNDSFNVTNSITAVGATLNINGGAGTNTLNVPSGSDVTPTSPTSGFVGTMPATKDIVTSYANIGNVAGGPYNLIINLTALGFNDDTSDDIIAETDATDTNLMILVGHGPLTPTLVFTGALADINSLSVEGSSDSEEFQINEVNGFLPTFPGSSPDGHTNAALPGAMSGINFEAGTGVTNNLVFNFTTTQTVFDYADTVGTANSGVVSVMGQVNASYEGLSPLNFNGAGGTITVSDFANGTVTSLTVTNPGTDGNTQVSGNGTWETVTLNGFDSLVVQGDNANNNTITLSSINPNANNGHSLTNLTLQGGAGNDTINVDTLPATITATLLGDFNGSNSTNSFNLDEEPAGAHNLFSQILGPVIVSPAGDGGGTSFDTLNIDDSGDIAGRTVLITSTTIDGITRDLTPPAITYDGSGRIAGVNIIGGAFGNTFNVQSTNTSTNPATIAGATGYTINTGAGNDTVNVSSTAPTVNGNGTLSGNLSGILGELDLNTGAGTNTLNVSDYSAGASATYSLSVAGGATTLTSSDAANIVYDANGDFTQLQFFNLTGSSTGGNTYNIGFTSATTQTTIGDGDASATGKAGSTFNINGDNLSAANDFKGFGGGNSFFLNIAGNLGDNSNPVAPLNSLTIEGDGGAANPGSDTVRNQLIVNDTSGTARQLNFAYQDTITGTPYTDNSYGNIDIAPLSGADNGLAGATVPGLAVQVQTMQTVIFNTANAGTNNDTDQITGNAGLNDVLTVAELPTDAGDNAALLPNGTVAGASVAAFLDGKPYIKSPKADLLNPGANPPDLPGVSGGGAGPDLLINGISGALTLNGNTNAGVAGKGNQAVVYAASENNLVDTNAAAPDIFGLGAGVLQAGFGAGNAYDTIDVNNGISGPDAVAIAGLVPVALNAPTFVQNGPAFASQQPAFIIDGGDEATPGNPPFLPGGIADNFFVTSDVNFNLQVNGNLPNLTTVNGVPQGDQLNLTFPGSVNVFSDGASPPNVTVNGQTSNAGNPFGVMYSSIERLNLSPGNGIVNIIGDDDIPGGPGGVPQNDYFKVRGGIDPFTVPEPTNGVGQFSLQIGGSWVPATGVVGVPPPAGGLSSPIWFFGVTRINAMGGAASGFDARGNAIPDTTDPAGVNALDITAYADNTPLGWGIETYWNQGNAHINDGGIPNPDLLIYNGVDGVSENITIQASASQAGQLYDVNAATDTPIAVINFTNNSNIIVNGNDGTAGDTDNLFLKGTDPANPSTSGNEDVIANFQAAGDALNPLVRVYDAGAAAGLSGRPTAAETADTAGTAANILYNLQSFSNINTFHFNSLGGNDVIDLIGGAPVKGLTPSTSPVLNMDIQGGTGDDNLIVNSAAGPVLGAINYNGGPGINALTFTSGASAGFTAANTATSDIYTPGSQLGSGTNTLVFPGGTEQVSFQNLSPIFDFVPGPLTVNGTNAANAINYQEGFNSLATFLSVTPNAAWGQVSVDGYEPIEFINQTSLTINGLAGSDEINLNNSHTPTGLTGITVNGNDPTASDTLIANGTAAADAINFTPTAADSGTITGAGPVNITFTGTEHVVINGQGGGDTLTVTGTAGNDTITATPGPAVDGGAVQVNSLVGVTYQNLGTGGAVKVNGNAGTDTLVVNGTPGNDTVSVTAATGAVTVNSDLPIQQTAVTNLVLNGLGGTDIFNLAGGLPYTSTTVNGSDPTVNLTGATGAVLVTLGNSAAVPPTNTTITGYGGTVMLVGVDTANLDANAFGLTAVGTFPNDVVTYTPSGAKAGTFQDEGVPTVFNFQNAGTFTVNGSAGSANQVVVNGTAGRDLLSLRADTRTATVTDASGTALEPVVLGADVQILTANGGTGENTFQVTPAVGTQFGAANLDNLVINVNGGGTSNALVEQSAAGGALAANQFVVDIKGATPGSGILRTYTAAVQWPDINYQDIQVVSPNVTGNNLLVLGPDVNEPNGTQASATFLGSGSTIQVQNASIFPNNAEFPGVGADNDFYRVVAQTTGTLDFQVYFRTFATTLLPAGGNLDIQVLDAAGNIIGDAAGAFGALATGGARVRIPVVAGQSYFLDVFGANPGTNTPNPAVINGYNATIINTAPPVPFNLELSRSTITATVTSGGSGYTFPPMVTISGAGGTGTGAVATAIVTNGVVTSITVGEGTGYVAPLTVTITGGGGSGATATAVISDTGAEPATSVNDDSGRSQFDNVTNVNKPTIFLNLADGFFLNDLPGNGTTDAPPVGVIPIPFSPNATTPGFRVAIFDSSNAQAPVTAGFATQVAGFPGLYKFVFTTALADGIHNLTAEVQMVDPATPTETGFGTQSLPLTLTVDTVPPPVTIGAVGSGGLTNAAFPAFFGTAEANAIIKVYGITTSVGAPLSATEAGNTVTLTFSSGPAVLVGQSIVVSGYMPGGYNGTFTVTGVDATTHSLTYTDPISGLAPATTLGAVSPVAPSVGTPVSATETGTTVTLTFAAAPLVAVGEIIIVSGFVPAGYNGTFVVTGVNLAAKTVTYTDATTGLAAATTLGTVTFAQSVLLAQTVAVPLDGTNADPNGYWSVQSNISMNNPAFFAPADGERTIVVSAEDLAGNISTAPQTSTIFIDTTGPQVTGVSISNPETGVESPYNLFGTKTGLLSFVLNGPGDSPGSGYTTPPAVTLTGGGATTQATVTAILGTGATAGEVVAFRIVTGGSGYISAPTVTIGAPPPGGDQAVATAFLTGLPNGPTPLVQALTIHIQDGPDRTAMFLYNAIEAGDLVNGGITVVGDHVGNIAIQHVLVTNNPPVVGQFATATVQLIFELPPAPGKVQPTEPAQQTGTGEALPDDRYTLTIADTSIIDPAGNELDGVSNASQPNGAPTFPSGTGVPGGPPTNFVARFTVDSRPEVGVWSNTAASIDANGDGIWDPSPPTGGDQTNVDYQFKFGAVGDYVFSGDFAPTGSMPGALLPNVFINANGYSKLGAYGYHTSGPQGAGYYWTLDLKGLGQPTWAPRSGLQLAGTPVAGHFDNAAAVRALQNGTPIPDQIGLLDNGIWYLDIHDNNNLVPGQVREVKDGLQGSPIVGNFTGQYYSNIDPNNPGNPAEMTPEVDLATYNQKNNTWNFDLNNPAIPGNPGPQVLLHNVVLGGFGATAFDGFGFPNDHALPVAADMNGDGVTDIGLYIRSQNLATATPPGGFYFLVSDPNVALSAGSLASLNHQFDPLPNTRAANPSLHDLYFKFLSPIALPLVGNFDPPTVPDVIAPATLPFSDAFSLPVGTQLSSSWTNEQGNFAVQSGVAAGANPIPIGVAVGLNKANVAVVDGAKTSDVTVEATLTDVPVGLDAGLIARYSGSGVGHATYYMGTVIRKGNAFIAEIVLHKAGPKGGKNIVLAKSKPITGAAVAGTTVQFTLSGSSLQLFVNGNLAVSATNTTLTAGTVGMQTTRGGGWSNFSAQ